MRMILVMVLLSIGFALLSIGTRGRQPAISTAAAGFSLLFGGLFAATFFGLL